MIFEGLVRLPNSLLLIWDPDTGEVPVGMESDLYSATDTCLTVFTLSPDDGHTMLRVELAGEPHSPTRAPSAIVDLVCPSGRLAATDTAGKALTEFEVPSGRARVWLWANDTSEPDQVHCVIEPYLGSPAEG